MATPQLNLSRPYDDRQANVRPSEGSGTTVLTIADSKWQIFNLSAARTVVLPSTSVKAGDVYRIDLRTAQILTIQSSSNAELTRLQSSGYVTYMAMIDSPSAAADWLYVNGAETVLGVAMPSPGFTQASPTNQTWYDISSAQNITLYTGSWHITAMCYVFGQQNAGSGKLGVVAGIRTGSTVITAAVLTECFLTTFSGNAWGAGLLASNILVSGATDFKMSVWAQTLGSGNTASNIGMNPDAVLPTQLQATRVGR